SSRISRSALPAETVFVAFRFHAPKRFSASAIHASSTAVSGSCFICTSSRSANRSRSVAGNFCACFSRASARAVIAFLSVGEPTTSVENSTRFNQSLQRQDGLPSREQPQTTVPITPGCCRGRSLVPGTFFYWNLFLCLLPYTFTGLTSKVRGATKCLIAQSPLHYRVSLHFC